MKKQVALMTAATYICLSNYCATYALISGQGHCPPSATQDQAAHEGERHDADHEAQAGAPSHDEHDAHSGEHDHPKGKPDPCCLTLPGSTPVILTAQPSAAFKAVVQSLALPVVQFSETIVEPPEKSYPNEHGPPRPALRDAFTRHLAGRAPPQHLPSL